MWLVYLFPPSILPIIDPNLIETSNGFFLLQVAMQNRNFVIAFYTASVLFVQLDFLCWFFFITEKIYFNKSSSKNDLGSGGCRVAMNSKWLAFEGNAVVKGRK